MDKIKWLDRLGEVHVCAAVENGYYEEENISLDIIPGIPSYVSAKFVSLDLNAMDTFGQADGSITVMARSEGLPIVCVGGLLADVVALASLKNTRVTVPKDLEGKRIGLAQGSGEMLLLPTLASLNKVNFEKIKITYLGPGSGREIEQGPKLLVEGSIDVYGGYLTGTIQDAIFLAKRRNKELNIMKYGSFGVHAYELCILCHQKLRQENPGLIRRFVRATMKGVVWVCEHQDEAAKIKAKHDPAIPLETARMRISAMVESLLRPEVLKNGLGWTGPETWNNIQDNLLAHKIIPTQTPTERMFTNEFLERGLLPASASL